MLRLQRPSGRVEVRTIEQLDEMLHAELQRHQPQSAGMDDTLQDISIRLTQRERVRRTRRICLTVASVMLLAGLGAGAAALAHPTATSTRPQPAIDPAAGPGGFSVTPSKDLVNGQHVTVDVHGLKPYASVWVTMCVGRPKTFDAGVNQCETAKMIQLSAKGSAHVQFSVDRYLSPGGSLVDCATAPKGCSLALVEPVSVGTRELVGNTEVVTFADMEPQAPNPLQMTISPSGPFKDGQAVTVAGTGFIANSMVRVGECPNADCEGRWQTVQTAANGSFVFTLNLQQRYVVEVGSSSGGEEPSEIDCVQPYTCFVVAQELTPPYKSPASIPLTFSATYRRNGGARSNHGRHEARPVSIART